MESLTLKQAIIQHYELNEQDYEEFVLNKTLFFRLRLLRPVVEVFYPEFLFNELRLIENAGKAIRMREIQDEIDFYQHKYVVNSLVKEALKFRLSGMKLIRLAHEVFREETSGNSNSCVSSAAQDSLNP